MQYELKVDVIDGKVSTDRTKVQMTKEIDRLQIVQKYKWLKICDKLYRLYKSTDAIHFKQCDRLYRLYKGTDDIKVVHTEQNTKCKVKRLGRQKNI